MYYYLYFLLLLVPCLILSAWASAKVNSTYSKYDKVANRSRMTGYDTAVRLLQRGGVTDISVNRVNGRLSDHYNAVKKQVNLSASTYGSASVAAVAVAAHEIGHVMQKKERYFPYLVRKALVPITNIGSRLALPVVILGLLLDVFLWGSAGLPYGTWILYAGIALYGLSTLFMLVTLPVEFNASRRAEKMLVAEGILAKEEMPAVRKVLSAAAMTYVASLLVSLVYFLRFLFVILSLARRND